MLALPRKIHGKTIRVSGLSSPLPACVEHRPPFAGAGQPPDLDQANKPLADFSPYYDASLLQRRMDELRIDRDQLASDDPLLFRELQGRCALCRSKQRCIQELAVDQNKIGREDWEKYCPNARTLNIIGALQNCGRAAQHLSWPRFG